ncbi:hypothetical protein HB662_15460 [Roseomonas frigidaquae]|uniref:Uncharacterized protein n=1 Tax=Falsiroseomonas frigidaquae TaxID=487318 RepID=A0ABX1F1J7_9PROT|nr:hypothetical protein [Falsiroseomonas frigidaquae]NKE46183.1 hypothetical protein [Falsiroseomonas frigidaquae]
MMVMIMPIVGVASPGPGGDLRRMRGSRISKRTGSRRGLGHLRPHDDGNLRPGWMAMKVAKAVQPATG